MASSAVSCVGSAPEVIESAQFPRTAGRVRADRLPARLRLSPVSSTTAADLSAEELRVLRSAGAWYAKYHAARMAELAEDTSAYGERRRDDYLLLVTALRKLGFDMALPDALRAIEQHAA
jgi:hypothetical protein